MATKNKIITSPKGTLKFPHLNKPDTKFNKEGVYTTKLLLDAHDASVLAYIGQLEEAYNAAIEDNREAIEEFVEKANKSKKGRKKDVEFEDLILDPPFFLDEETNQYEVNFKMNSQFTSKTTGEVVKLTPKVFDAALKPFNMKTIIAGGSIARVRAELIPFFYAGTGAGLSLRLNAVQIIDLKEWGGDTTGFDVEDGYISDDADEPEDETEGFDTEDDGSSDGDF